MMRWRKHWIIGGLLVLVTGCVSTPLPLEMHRGEIVRIYQPAGDFYTATQERKPLTFVYVRIDATKSPHGSRIIKISVFDLYSAEVHGAGRPPVRGRRACGMARRVAFPAEDAGVRA